MVTGKVVTEIVPSMKCSMHPLKSTSSSLRHLFGYPESSVTSVRVSSKMGSIAQIMVALGKRAEIKARHILALKSLTLRFSNSQFD